MKELGTGKYKPVYLLHGYRNESEDYFIDEACAFFEKQLLTEQEKDFNLAVFYGKEANWSDVINACRRYPMFSERQVVILKEAQSMKKQDFEQLAYYLEDIMPSTVFVITYKGKAVDGRTKLFKLIRKEGEILETRKVFDNQLPAWIRSYVQSKGYTITDKAVMILANHIGADLSVMTNELGKIFINAPEGSRIDDAMVEEFVGISREFNVFEFQNALGRKDVPKVVQILRYFEGNPKAAPLPLLLPVLYNFFSKMDILLKMGRKSSGELAAALGVAPFFLKDYQDASRFYDVKSVERAILLLHEYNLRMLGIHDSGTGEKGLLKELVAKILQF